MSDIVTFHTLWLIVAFPALGATLIFLFATQMRARTAGGLACTCVGLSFLWVLVCGWRLLTATDPSGALHESLWTWLNAGVIRSEIGFHFDRLALAFSLIVSGVGFLIHLYSYAYMDEDEGERRYFGYMNLFVATMLILVTASNGFFMFMGWEGVGACSFFLIGHWYKSSDNVAAAQKAFIVTRLGDIFLLLGLLLCAQIASVQFADLSSFERWKEPATRFLGVSGPTLLLAAGLLLLGGAIGKSAQIPLQVWLPDAMAGPTPVSALIHAATMVTAGVYLIARFHILFALSPPLMHTVAVIGVATAFLGATCAIVQTDIKRILAYSTISQIGYMVLGLGVGAFALGVFHFFTHAFFKALLFMAAGAVIHALHGEQNIYNMGGLRRPLRGVFWAFVAGAASLAGIPLITAGYFSKDAILWSTLTTPLGNQVLYAVGLFTAFLTAIYSFRLIFVVFFGEPRKEHHLHHLGPLFTWPLYILAVLALIAGWLNIPRIYDIHPLWERWLGPVFGPWTAHPKEHMDKYEWVSASVSGLISLAGVGVAWLLFSPKRAIIPAPRHDIGEVRTDTPLPYRLGFANFLFHGWKFDRLYDLLFVSPFRRFAAVWAWIDRVIVDGFFELINALARGMHNVMLAFQNGRISRYALVMLFGAVAITSILLTIYAR